MPTDRNTYSHTYIRIYRIHTYIQTSLHTYIHTSRHPYIHTYIRTYVHIYMHACHTYIHTHTHILQTMTSNIHTTSVHGCTHVVNTSHTHMHRHTHTHSYTQLTVINTKNWFCDAKQPHLSTDIRQHPPFHISNQTQAQTRID